MAYAPIELLYRQGAAAHDVEEEGAVCYPGISFITARDRHVLNRASERRCFAILEEQVLDVQISFPCVFYGRQKQAVLVVHCRSLTDSATDDSYYSHGAQTEQATAVSPNERKAHHSLDSSIARVNHIMPVLDTEEPKSAPSCSDGLGKGRR